MILYMHSSHFAHMLYCTCIIYGSTASRALVKQSEGSFSGWSCRLSYQRWFTAPVSNTQQRH